METKKQETIGLLNDMIATYEATIRFADTKLSYLNSGNPNTIRERAEFESMKIRSNCRIAKIKNCITWLNKEVYTSDWHDSEEGQSAFNF